MRGRALPCPSSLNPAVSAGYTVRQPTDRGAGRPREGMRFFADQLTLGLTDGAIFALIALGYTMVYGIIELINFAHGDIFTVGGFIGLSLIGLLGLQHASPALLIPGIVVVFVLAMGLNGLLGVLIERVAYRPLRNAPRLAPLITAVGISFILEGILFLLKGPNHITYPNLLPS